MHNPPSFHPRSIATIKHPRTTQRVVILIVLAIATVISAACVAAAAGAAAAITYVAVTESPYEFDHPPDYETHEGEYWYRDKWNDERPTEAGVYYYHDGEWYQAREKTDD